MVSTRSPQVLILLLLLLTMAPGVTPRGVDAAQSCSRREQVELYPGYPGYPGYRGYIAGLVGEHETACLDDLEDMDDSFSRRQEVRENLEAAGDLGIRGGLEDFTWENWLAIEAERGLPSTCYSCLIFAESRLPTSIIPGDPRSEMGWVGQKAFATAYFQDAANRSALIERSHTDDELRAIAGLVAGGDLLNAPQTIDLMEEVLEAWFSAGQYLDTPKLWDLLVSQGGYVPAPDGISPPDQLFLVFAGFYGVSRYSSASWSNTMLIRLNQIAAEWQDELLRNPRSAPTFAEFLQDSGWF